MNKRKQKRLLAAARVCASGEPPSNFSSGVIAAIARDDSRPAMRPLFEQLSALFPRIAVAAVVIISVAIAFEFYEGDNIAMQLAQVSEQWLLPLDWL